MSNGLTVELDELLALKGLTKRQRQKTPTKAMMHGSHSSSLRGRGMDFAEVRHYQAGDEIRHMEWRVTARTGRPHSKVYEEERERPVILVTDFNPSMYFGSKIALKSVVAAQLAALIAWTAVQSSDKVGGFLYALTTHTQFIPRARTSAMLPLLAALSDYTKQLPSTPPTAHLPELARVLTKVRRVARPGSLLVLISDFYQLTEECVTHIKRLQAHHDFLAYRICDTLELAAPPPARYGISNGREELLLGLDDPALRMAYQAFCDEQQQQIHSRFKRLQINCTTVTAYDDLARLVWQTFPRKRR